MITVKLCDSLPWIFPRHLTRWNIISCPPSLNNYIYLHILLIGITVFLSGRQQHILSGNYHCRWKAVNKGTTQGSVSGPHLFNIFLNDFEITYDGFPALFKYADDSTIVAPVLGNTDTSVTLVNEFLNWSRENCMSCNPSKCKELVIRKKSKKDTYNPVNCIP